MSMLSEISCSEHKERGYESTCTKCDHVLHVAVLRHSLDQCRLGAPKVTNGLLAVASPTIARKAYYALSAAMGGRTLSEENRAMLVLLRDMMQDCVERLR